MILSRTNMNLKSPALALATLGALHSLFILYAMPETNAKVLKRGYKKLSLFDIVLTKAV